MWQPQKFTRSKSVCMQCIYRRLFGGGYSRLCIYICHATQRGCTWALETRFLSHERPPDKWPTVLLIDRHTNVLIRSNEKGAAKVCKTMRRCGRSWTTELCVQLTEKLCYTNIHFICVLFFSFHKSTHTQQWPAAADFSEKNFTPRQANKF